MFDEKNKGKCLLEFMRSNDLDLFGSVMTSEKVREVLSLRMPEVATKKEFDAIALQELAAVDYVRNVLLDEGKYLAMRDGGYRILLPSENARQVESYMHQADKKLRRALKLNKNTPRSGTQKFDNVAARILMKRESIHARNRLANIHR